jgi:hypothetical protein
VVKDRIFSPDYDFLSKDFTPQEVTEAIKSLKGNFAPGPDGLSALFYHKYWNIIGTDILNFSLNILNIGGSIDDINHTFICLI